MQSVSPESQAGTARSILVVKKGTKARLDELKQKLGTPQARDDDMVSLLIDKYYQLAQPTTEEPQA